MVKREVEMTTAGAPEGVLVGWQAIAEFVGVSDRTMRSRKPFLLRDEVIFYRRQRLGKRVVCAFVSDLKVWWKKQCRPPGEI